MKSNIKLVNLQDYCDKIQYGYTQSASMEKVGPKFLRITDIQTKPIKWNEVPYCVIIEKDYKKYKLENGDIVIARTGASTGRNAIYSEGMPDAVFASYLIRIKMKKEFIPKYVYYYLQSQKYSNHIYSIIGGSAQPNANAKELTNVLIPLHDINVQKKIVELLSSLDDKIEINISLNSVLEEMGKAIFRRWFVEFEFPDEVGKPYHSNGGPMEKTPQGEMPENWNVGKLQDIITITSGKRHSNRNKTKNEIYQYPIFGASKIMGYTTDYLYNEPILIIGRVGTHGIIQRASKPSFPSDNTLVIKSEYYNYIYFILSNIDYTTLNIGTTQPLITQTSIKNLNIIIPDDKILHLFEKLMSNIFNLIDNNINENHFLSELRDSLLPRLMSGKIRLNL